jgi:hypothetical protein
VQRAVAGIGARRVQGRRRGFHGALRPERRRKTAGALPRFSGLLAAGGNIYFLIKLGVVTGNGLYVMGAKMRGESYEQFLATRNDSGAT